MLSIALTILAQVTTDNECDTLRSIHSAHGCCPSQDTHGVDLRTESAPQGVRSHGGQHDAP